MIESTRWMGEAIYMFAWIGFLYCVGVIAYTFIDNIIWFIKRKKNRGGKA